MFDVIEWLIFSDLINKNKLEEKRDSHTFQLQIMLNVDYLLANKKRVITEIVVWCFNLYLVASVYQCTRETHQLTWENINDLKIKTRVDGVDFDIPYSYTYHSSYNYFYYDPPLPEVRINEDRSSVDYVHINVLVPELEPVSENNLDYFIERGWGRKLKASITHARSFAYYFRHTAPKRLVALEASPEVPGMLHYQDNITEEHIYLSHDHAVPEMTFFTCDYYRPGQSASCEIETQYNTEITRMNGDAITQKSTPFYLKYRFSRTYLSQWRAFDKKIKALYDQFAQSALKSN